MIEKRDGRKGHPVRVTFEMPAGAAQQRLSVVGDFNDWNPEAHPMKRLKNGTWKKDIYLEPEKAYEFRYFADGRTWLNDEGADRYVPGPYAAENGVVDL